MFDATPVRGDAHEGRAGELRQYRRRSQRRRSRRSPEAGRRTRSVLSERPLGPLEGTGRAAARGQSHGQRTTRSDALRPRVDRPEEKGHRSRRSRTTAELWRVDEEGRACRGDAGQAWREVARLRCGRLRAPDKAKRAETWPTRARPRRLSADYYVADGSIKAPHRITDGQSAGRAISRGRAGATGRLHERQGRQAPGRALPARRLRAGQALSDGRLHLRGLSRRRTNASRNPTRTASTARSTPAGLCRAHAGHRLQGQRSRACRRSGAWCPR